MANVIINPNRTGPYVVISGGNLTITGTSSYALDSGALATGGPTTGQYYFEATFNTITNTETGIGITPDTTDYNNLGNHRTSLCGIYGTGSVYVNGFGTSVFPSFSSGAVIGFAVNAATNLVWFRVNGGAWNNNGAANPITGSGGIGVATVPQTWFPFGSTSGLSNDSITFNFGASAYANAAPTGFLNWPTIPQQQNSKDIAYAELIGAVPQFSKLNAYPELVSTAQQVPKLNAILRINSTQNQMTKIISYLVLSPGAGSAQDPQLILSF